MTNSQRTEADLGRGAYEKAEAVREAERRLPNFFYMTRTLESTGSFPDKLSPVYGVREFTSKEELDQYVQLNGMSDRSFIAKRLESKVDLTLSE